MMRRGVLAGIALLVLGGCSGADDAALLARLGEYETRLETLDQQLLESSESYARDQENLHDRVVSLVAEYSGQLIDLLDQIAGMQATVSELGEQQSKQDLLIASLKEEVERLESQLARLQTVRTTQSAPVQRRAAPKQEPAKPVTPAFDVTGIELRGGRPFVAVASHSAQSLNEVQLLEVGDSFSGWRVSRVGDQAAEFVSGTGTVELTVQ